MSDIHKSVFASMAKLLGAFVVAFLALNGIIFLFAPAPPTWTSLSKSTINPAIVNPMPMMPAIDDETLSAVAWAVDSWSKSLNRSIKMPKAFHGDAHRDCSNDDALACANEENYTIVITCRRWSKSGLRSVMLHEVAHLLKVPHIEGDPLMEPSLELNVDRPTDFAVALAKVANGWK